ncbi:MAG: hypothetical protein AAGA85_09620 [Bacteroidota bacterium]
MTRFFSVFLISIILFNCSSPKREVAEEQEVEMEVANPTTDQLMEQVMALHDAVMPEMGNIRSTEKALRTMAETASDEAARSTYTQQADMLDSAFSAMMVWMRQFDPEYAGTDEEIKGYLTDQKEQMAQVKDLMETALADGKALVEKAQ